MTTCGAFSSAQSPPASSLSRSLPQRPYKFKFSMRPSFWKVTNQMRQSCSLRTLYATGGCIRFWLVMSHTAVAAKAQMPPVVMLIDTSTAPSIASFCAQCSAGPDGLPSALSESATTNTHMALPKTAPPATPYLPAQHGAAHQRHAHGGARNRANKQASKPANMHDIKALSCSLQHFGEKVGQRRRRRRRSGRMGKWRAKDARP